MSDEVSDQNASDAGGLEPPAAPAEAIWQRLLFWFYLDRGMLPLVYRLCGLAFVPSCIWLYFASHQPLYTVPTWRIGQSFLWLPALPEALDRIIMVGAILSAIMLVAGFKQRLFVIWPALALWYYGCRDLLALQCHYIVMLLIYFTALSLDRPGAPSMTRRIIQLGVASCYGFAVAERLISSDYLTGKSFYYTVGTGWAANDLFRPLFIELGKVDWIWMPMAWAVLILELFLAFGFFFRKTRMTAFVLGVMLHLAIAVSLNITLIIYSLAMVTGYFAFFEAGLDGALGGRQKTTYINDRSAACGVRDNALRSGLGLAFICLMFAIPARIFLFQDRPLARWALHDRDPWSFGMFIMKMEPVSVKVRWKDRKGNVRAIDTSSSRAGRLRYASADSDLLAIAGYVFATHPDAVSVDMRLVIKQDDWYQVKTAEAERGKVEMMRITVNNLSPGAFQRLRRSVEASETVEGAAPATLCPP